MKTNSPTAGKFVSVLSFVAALVLPLGFPGTTRAASIICGQQVTNSTTADTQIDAYTYSGTVGQEVAFAFWVEAGGAMQADIYSPDGQLLGSVGQCCNNGQSLALTLTNGGTFTILVHSAGYNSTGSYALNVQSLVGGGCSPLGSVICGQPPVTNTTAYYTEMDTYTYNGAAGQEVAFAFWVEAGGSMQADIYNPGGQLLGSIGACCNNGQSLALTLTNSGTFTIVVRSSGYNSTGSYDLSVQSLIGGGCNPLGAVICGQPPVTNTTTYYTEMDTYNYSGTAGQEVAFAFWVKAGGSMQADIYNPGGQLLWSIGACCNNGESVALTLTNSGTFTILVRSSGYNSTGSYDLSIQSLIGGGCYSAPISCGQTISSFTRFNTEMAAYGFGYGGGGVIFTFDGNGTRGMQFDLYDPSGNQVFSAAPGTTQNTNLSAGTYTMLVHNSGYSSTGTYGFTVTCLGPCNYLVNPTGPMAVGATGTNGSVTVTAGSGCDWTATANATWLHVTNGVSGLGNGTVDYSVDPNVNPGQRSGTLTVAGYTVIVNQANPVVFMGQDIGTPGAPGSFGYTNGVYTVNGSGEGTDGSADVFYFLHQTLSGDAQIVARLRTLQGGDPQLAEAGVMIRQSLDSGSEQVSLSFDQGRDLIFRRRLATDGFGVETGIHGTNYLQGTNYLWLRLMRMGDTFVAHYSTNGLNWQYMWFTTLTMSNQVEVGLEVTAHHYGQLATAAFDQVSTGGLTPLPGGWSLSGPLLLNGGQNWSPAEFERVGGYEFLLSGAVGDSFSVRSSTNVALPFSSWPALVTVTNVYGVTPVRDSRSLSNSTLFYRAKALGGP